MKKKLFLLSSVLILALLLINTQPVYANSESKIIGKVTDEIEKPIHDKEVTLKRLTEDEFHKIDSTWTDEDGRFSFSIQNTNKTYLIEVNHQGITYKEIIDPKEGENKVDFSLQEVSDLGIIKGKIIGDNISNVFLYKENELIESQETNSSYYRFNGLEKDTEYTVSLEKDGVRYNKTAKTDENPLSSQIVNFNFSSSIQVEYEILGEKPSEESIEVNLFQNNQMVTSKKTKNQITFTNLLKDNEYRLKSGYNEGKYIKTFKAGSINKEEIKLFGNGRLWIQESEIETKIFNGSSPSILVKEEYLINKTSFLLNNSIGTSSENYTTVSGEVNLSLPNKEIENLEANLNGISPVNVEDKKTYFEFDDLKIKNQDEVILSYHYSPEKKYNSLFSREDTLKREFDKYIEKISLLLEINNSGKFSLSESVETNFNSTKSGDEYILNNTGDSDSFRTMIQWSTISNIQLLLYGGVLLGIGLGATYAVFITLIGRKNKKDEEELDEDFEEDEKTMKRAAKAALTQLRRQYMNGEIGKEEYNEKKKRYQKIAGGEDEED